MCANGVEHCVNEVSFVDDSAISLVDTADKIVDETVAVASAAVNVFGWFCMEGKSEAIAVFCGPGHKKYRIKLVTEMGSQVEFRNRGRSDVYKNLGTMQSIGSSPAVEVVTKSVIMRNESQRLRSKTLGNSGLSDAK